MKKEARRGGVVLRLAEKMGASALDASVRSASIWLVYQEEEPDGIADLLKRRKSCNY